MKIVYLDTEKLKTLMAENGVTVKELATKAKSTPKTIKKYLEGEQSGMSILFLFKVARVFHVEVIKLLAV